MKNDMMKAVVMPMFLLCFSCSTLFAQNTSKPTPTMGNVMTALDKDLDSRIKDIEKKIAKCNDEIKAQEGKLNQRYRDVSIDVQYELNMREDSIYLTLCSQRKTLMLQVSNLRQESLRNFLNSSRLTVGGKKQKADIK